MKTEYVITGGVILDVRDPVRAGNEVINVTIEHSVYGTLEFSAMPNDSEAHGRDIYARCLAGDFGLIAEKEVPDNGATAPAAK